ncbi:AAA family ATPase [Bradyrhizobium sp. SZCCHNR1093]|uniref:AAA family ATPase n=1 Tax=Bradyrhizobium sp. SZCCHNR1093 TaxID=3057368 RepID=UPI0028EF75E0|nr:AAA family ATPase [Bradyrhizobium sp. SZCCHNR1093]
MITMSSSDIGRNMEFVARKLLGEPNAHLSSKTELRYGTNGSMSIDLSKGTFYDFEQEQGGGVLQLIERETGKRGADAKQLLDEIDGAAPRPTANGRAQLKFGQPVALYNYVDEHGNLLFQVARYQPKTFKQRRPDGSGGWVWNTEGIARVPYRLRELIEAEHDATLIVEGEKDVDGLYERGFVATTNPGGAGKWHPDLSRHFKGRDVVIIPDNDEPGEKHAAQVAAALRGIARSVRILRLPGLPAKGDVSDWFATGGTADELAKLIDEVPAEQPSEAKHRLTYFNDCAVAVRKRWIMKGLLAFGETSAWIGPPGCGKSALLTEIAVHCASADNWRGHKAKQACGVVILALERADLCKRRLHAYAQRDGLVDLPIAVHAGVIDLMNPSSVSLIAEIIREAERQFDRRVGLVVVDTFAKSIAAGGGDEDKARDQNRVAANLRLLQEELEVHVALIGHTGKDEGRGARGSNAHLGDVDLMVQISGNGVKVVEITKANDQAERVVAQFRLEQIVLGTDDDGDDVTTAIVSVGEVMAPIAPKQRKVRLRPNERTMFNLLYDAGRALTTPEWDELGKAAGLGEPRRADLTDARNGLKRKKLVRVYCDKWTVDHRSD